MNVKEIRAGIAGDEASLARYRRDLRELEQGGEVENLTIEGCREMIAGIEACIANKRQLLHAHGWSVTCPYGRNDGYTENEALAAAEQLKARMKNRGQGESDRVYVQATRHLEVLTPEQAKRLRLAI